MLEALMNLDGNILMYIQEFLRNSVMTPFFIFITSLGNGGMVWIAISIILLIPKRTRKIGCMAVCALLGSLLINNLILKNLVGRIRPYDAIEGLVPLITKPVDASFPSGHTGSSFAAACVLYRRLPKKYGIPIMILAVLIALSRLYIGVHYPTDVLCGLITGVLISYAAEWLTERFYPDEKSDMAENKIQ